MIGLTNDELSGMILVWPGAVGPLVILSAVAALFRRPLFGTGATLRCFSQAIHGELTPDFHSC